MTLVHHHTEHYPVQSFWRNLKAAFYLRFGRHKLAYSGDVRVEKHVAPDGTVVYLPLPEQVRPAASDPQPLPPPPVGSCLVTEVQFAPAGFDADFALADQFEDEHKRTVAMPHVLSLVEAAVDGTPSDPASLHHTVEVLSKDTTFTN